MPTFGDALAVLLEGFPKFDLSDSQEAMWQALLSDVPPEALCIAAAQLARESRFAPSIAEWRERALTASGKGAAHALSAADAWEVMRRNRRAYSPYASHEDNERRVRWPSEAVRRAAEAVCWTDMNWTSEQIPTIRAQFERYYNSIAGKQNAIDASNDAAALMPMVQALMGRTDAKQLYGADYRDPLPEKTHAEEWDAKDPEWRESADIEPGDDA